MPALAVGAETGSGEGRNGGEEWRRPDTGFTPEKRARFLEVLGETANVTTAAADVGISRVTAYAARRRHPDFASAWDEAVDLGTDALEDEAARRARDGVPEPVFQGGKLAGHVQRYSDTLLIFLLKARRPEKYRERVDMTRSDDPLHTMTEAEIDARIAQLERKARAVEAASGEVGADGAI